MTGGGEREEEKNEQGGGEETKGGFKYVTRSSNKKKGKKNRRTGKGAIEEAEDSQARLARRVQIIAAKKSYLSEGRIGDEIRILLDTVFAAAATSTGSEARPTSILTLGLGTVKSSRSSQMQLAFLLIVRDKLLRLQSEGQEDREDDDEIPVEAYDPVFDEEDRLLLEHYRIDTSANSAKGGNVQGRYRLDRPTFVYLPHCPKGLYENLLRSNWSQGGLQRLWLCCNDLERYYSSSATSSSPSSSKSLIDRIVPKLKVHHLPNLPSPHTDALNDLAIQRFDREKDSSSLDYLADQIDSVRLSPETNDDTLANGDTFWHVPEDGDDSLKDPELQ